MFFIFSRMKEMFRWELVYQASGSPIRLSLQVGYIIMMSLVYHHGNVVC